MRTKRILAMAVTLFLCALFATATVSASDWDSSLSITLPKVNTLVNAETLQPQSTGYAALDTAIANRLKLSGNSKASAKLEWFYIWLQTSITESTEGYSKPTNPGYGDWTWGYNELTPNPASPIPEEMANRVYHLLTQQKGMSYDRAAAFAVVARYLGITSYVYTGTYRLEGGGTVVPHGWAELELGGNRYVFDPERDNACHKALKQDWTYYFYGIPTTKLARYTPDTAANAARDDLMRPLGQALILAKKSGTGTATVTGGGTYKYGDSVTLTATPGADTIFLGWYDGAGKLIKPATENPYTFTVKADATIYAKFEGKVTLTVKTKGSGSGTVAPTTGTYMSGTTVMAKAIPDSDSVFVGWYDRLDRFLSSKPTYSFAISANTTIYAMFSKNVSVTVTVCGPGSVSGTGTYLSDAPVTLTATPDSGSSFMGWFDSDDTLLETKPTYTFTPTADTNVVAKFGIHISAITSCNASVSGTGLYVPGDTVTLTATCTDGFDGWYTTKGVLLSSNATYSFVAASDLELIAMAAGDAFYDIGATAWYRSNAIEASELNLVSGMAPLQFGASVTLTRAMVVQLLASLSGEDTASYAAAPFVDIPQTAWFAKSVNWAYENNIVAGMDATHFNPNGAVTREQFLTILMRYAENYKNYAVPSAPLTFADTDTVSNYAVKWLEKANSIEIERDGKIIRMISGYSDNTLRPKNRLTRAEGVSFLVRFVYYLDAYVPAEPPEEPSVDTPQEDAVLSDDSTDAQDSIDAGSAPDETLPEPSDEAPELVVPSDEVPTEPALEEPEALATTSPTE